MNNFLTESFKEQHKELVRIVLEAVAAHKIYFLGSTIVNRRTESIFMTDSPSFLSVGHYYILVLVDNDNNLNSIQDKIENKCQHFIPVTAIVLHTEKFNEWLIKAANPFADLVCRMAPLLYGTGEKSDIPSEKPGQEFIKAKNNIIYNEGLNKVTEFMAGADLYRIRLQNKMAAFMLHQATEHVLHTILKIKAGFYVNTHNIDKLIRYCSMVSYQLPEIFAGNNNKHEHLFQLLNKAYIDTRYRDDYSITMTELLAITGRVHELQNIMKDLCKPR